MDKEEQPKGKAPVREKGSPEVHVVRFNQNRSFELHLRHTVIRFEPFESRKLTREQVDSDDFKSVARYFTVTKEG